MRLKTLLAAAVAGVVAMQFYQPERTNPPADPSASFEAARNPPSDVVAVLDRACRDCHSHRTVWPWYSRISPLGWLIARDVRRGRSHLNFSEWSRYGPEASRHKLIEACEEMKAGQMPLKSYRLLHPEARLDSAEIERFCRWVEQLP